MKERYTDAQYAQSFGEVATHSTRLHNTHESIVLLSSVTEQTAALMASKRY